eukprot:7075335-Pyramimonas_sp.AAC.1
MCQPHGPTARATPKGGEGEQEVAWQELWDSCDLLRAMVARPETWGATFLSSFVGMLEPRERLAIPGTMEQVVWVGGDSTLEVAGQIDWAAK